MKTPLLSAALLALAMLAGLLLALIGDGPWDLAADVLIANALICVGLISARAVSALRAPLDARPARQQQFTNEGHNSHPEL